MRQFRFRFTEDAEADLLRLFGHLVQHDVDAAVRAEQGIAGTIEALEFFPFSCRKVLGGN